MMTKYLNYLNPINLIRSEELDEYGFPIHVRDKFLINDGITLFFNKMSPCAMRVLISAMEKEIELNIVEVDLTNRETHHPDFLKFNSLGKIPTVVIQNVSGIDDCVIFESNAITEWFDEQYPESGNRLYPLNIYDRAKVKMWQRWEMSMAEDFWPLMYVNTRGYLERAKSNRENYIDKIKRRHANDKYMIDKLIKTYDGNLLTEDQIVRNITNLYRWLDILEYALEEQKKTESEYIVGDKFSIADLIVTRVRMYPLLGLLNTWEEREEFYPNVTEYIDRLNARESFNLGGTFSSIGIKLASWLPWGIITYIGNWRSEQKHKRIEGYSILEKVYSDDSENISMEIMDMKNEIENEDGDNITLYTSSIWPEAIAVEIAMREMNIPYKRIEIDILSLEHKTEDYLTNVNPHGEVPTLFYNGNPIYDPKNIVEYLGSLYNEELSDDPYIIPMKLMPMEPIKRCQVRMLEGFVNTCFHYQFKYLYEAKIIHPMLRKKFVVTDDMVNELSQKINDEIMVDNLVQIYKRDYVEMDLSPYRDGLLVRLEYIEKLLYEANYLVDNRLTFADIFLYSLVSFFESVDIELEKDRFPNILKWFDNLHKEKIALFENEN